MIAHRGTVCYAMCDCLVIRMVFACVDCCVKVHEVSVVECPGELQAGSVDHGRHEQAGLPAAFYSEEESVLVSTSPVIIA